MSSSPINPVFNLKATLPKSLKVVLNGVGDFNRNKSQSNSGSKTLFKGLQAHKGGVLSGLQVLNNSSVLDNNLAVLSLVCESLTHKQQLTPVSSGTA